MCDNRLLESIKKYMKCLNLTLTGYCFYRIYLDAIVKESTQKQCSKMRCPDYNHGKESDVEKYVVHEP